ncbi:ATP-binding protein [Methylocystis sp. IM3]|jgi:serine/threonine-protein kinase RsbW|uniref:ATP-binding protein n=1 Tax=unclassified Methylocystis TaxID=2625913 RepID=UPI00311A1447
MRNSQGSELHLDIRVPNRTKYLKLVGNIAELVASEIDIAASKRDALAYHLNLVVTEAVTNAIQYGRKSAAKAKVRILLLYTNKDLCVRVYDHGTGFDLDSAGPPDDLLSERGRGLFLIRWPMDSIEYYKTKSGNILEMKKRVE